MARQALAHRLRALGAFDTPTVANAMEMLAIGPAKSLGGDLRLLAPTDAAIVGIAATATMREQQGGQFAHLDAWLNYLDEIASAAVPVIAVFKDESPRPGIEAMIGEGMSLAMKACGAVGAIVDGCIRDVRQVRASGFPVLSRGFTPDRGRIKFHSFQIPVEIAGVMISPGDVIHADENGAIVVPLDRLTEITQAAEAVAAKESRMFKMFRKASFRVAELREFYASALESAKREQQDRTFG